MKQKLTPWYPPEIKPVRKGVYQVKEANWIWHPFAYFDGNGFGFRHRTSELAFRNRGQYTCLDPEIEWRGLARKPK